MLEGYGQKPDKSSFCPTLRVYYPYFKSYGKNRPEFAFIQLSGPYLLVTFKTFWHKEILRNLSRFIEIHWNSFQLNEIHWKFVEMHWDALKFIEKHWKSTNFSEIHENSRKSIGISLNFSEMHCNSLELNRIHENCISYSWWYCSMSYIFNCTND